MRWLTVFLFISFIQEPEPKTIFPLTPNVFKDQANASRMYDFRIEQLFNLGHIPNTIHLDASSSSFKYTLVSLDKTLTYYIYDEFGVNIQVVAKTMKQIGFKKVYYLKGGFKAWKDAGLPVSYHYAHLVDSLGHHAINDSTAHKLTCDCTKK